MLADFLLATFAAREQPMAHRLGECTLAPLQHLKLLTGASMALHLASLSSTSHRDLPNVVVVET